jgi:hypothetical protein
MTTAPLELRSPCPPGVCICERERLLADPTGDQRILQLTRAEERRLLQRLENLASLADLEHLRQRMHEQLGLRVQVQPGRLEVRSMRGLQIVLQACPGLCRKTRRAIPAAIRRGLEKHPEIAFELLNGHDLLRDA